MPGVVSVGQQQGLLDQVLKGVEIAKTIYGIKQQGDANDIAQQRADQEGGVLADKVARETAQQSVLNQAAAEKMALEKDKFAYQQKKDSAPKPESAITAFQQAQLDLQRDRLNQTKAGSTATNSGKTYTELVKAVETPRGNQAVQQASKALVNIGNAEELLAPYQGNLDAIDQKTANLLTAELSKIASGGVGSQHGQEAIEAKTFNSELQALKSRFGNEPEPAELGAFLQKNVDYLQGLKTANQSIVNGYKLRMYNGYKNRLTPEENTQFKEEYADLFQGAKEALPSSKDTPRTLPKDTSGMALGAEGIPLKSAGMSPTVIQNGHTYYLNPKTGKYE